MTTQDLVLIIGAYSAFVLGAFGLLTKFVLDTRKNTNETNRMVNGRPKDDPTLRDLVEHIDTDVRRLRDESFARHQANSRRIDTVSGSVERVTNKLDRLGDAVAGQNVRIDAVHSDLLDHMRTEDEPSGA